MSGIYPTWRARRAAPLALTGSVLLCMACSEEPGDESKPAAPAATTHAAAKDEPPTPPKPRTVEEAEPDMVGHYVQATLARDALTRGDLPTFREASRQLAAVSLGAELPEKLEPRQKALAALAKHAGRSDSLREASKLSGQIAAACGQCHSAAGAGPERTPQGLTEDGEDVQAHMLRHQWALDRLWEGLATPWDEAWKQGAEALVELPMPKAKLRAQAKGKVSAEHEQAVHALGERARAATTLGARSAVFGDIVQACASCHAQASGGPGSSEASHEQLVDHVEP